MPSSHLFMISEILKQKKLTPQKEQGSAFAPTNIAVCKYWGKRDTFLNLPTHSSLSITLPTKGTHTVIRLCESETYTLNDERQDSSFGKRVKGFLELFPFRETFSIESFNTVPLAAGVASSASGFAALVLALDDLYAWHLSRQELSILARIGSGSACRSLWNGFVEWQEGERADGMDSHGVPLEIPWSDLRVGLLLLDTHPKAVSSRNAMEATKKSPFYEKWPKIAEHDLSALKEAIAQQDFQTFGQVSESNALSMHALMLSARPAISYFIPQTWEMIEKIWRYRQQGLDLYFTQDAGPNLKLLFLEKDQESVENLFPEAEILRPFDFAAS